MTPDSDASNETNDPKPIIVEAPRLRPSPTVITFIQHWETLALKAYMPTPNDRPTLGWGRTFWPDRKGVLRPVRMGMTCTPEEADRVFYDELGRRAAKVRSLLVDTPTTPPQFDALVSFADNVGVEALEESTLLRYHQERRPDFAAAQFSLWIYQGKTRLKGLIKRRAMEAALYETPEGRDPPWLIRTLRPGQPDLLTIKEPKQ